MDLELLRRGLVSSRGEAVAALSAGRVVVAGSLADKPARLVAPDEPIVVLPDAPRFVSRGGEKLEAALDTFRVSVAGRPAADLGASTGGFTDCLLRRGASPVAAVDVGHGQLHPRLRSDPRVVVLEKTNVRELDLGALGGIRPEVVVADLSFISLRTVAAAIVRLAEPGGDLVLLVKPQFEAGRVEASRGRGVIRSPEVWTRVLCEVRDAFASEGAVMMGVMVSPLTGPKGNVEFLAHFRSPGGESSEEAPSVDIAAVVAAVSVARGH